jgi:hypothetical protein
MNFGRFRKVVSASPPSFLCPVVLALGVAVTGYRIVRRLLSGNPFPQDSPFLDLLRRRRVPLVPVARLRVDWRGFVGHSRMLLHG